MSEDASDRRTAVVTGATGGIGGALSARLAREGWDVVLIGRDTAALEAACERIAAMGPGTVITVRADLARAAEAITGAYPKLHALMNVAGVLTPAPRPGLQGVDLELEVNVLAPLALIRALEASLAAGAAASGPAVVVNASSNAAGLSGPLNVGRLVAPTKPGVFGSYGQTKLALTAATAAMAPALAAKGIKTYAVDPGGNRTGMTAGRGAPFFVRWMHRLLPGPETGAARLAAPLAAGWDAPPGAFVTGGKAKPIPKKADASDTLAALLTQIRKELGWKVW
ncbi:MAG: SDR family NAD(P)-dependent oxidoreductase [Pseudomonadota bacterium]